LPPQQIAPVYRPSASIGEYQIARISMLRPLPEGFQNTPQDSEGIEWDAPASGIGLGVVELAFIESLDDIDSVRVNSFPTLRHRDSCSGIQQRSATPAGTYLLQLDVPAAA
jgi:hypothetical protein